MKLIKIIGCILVFVFPSLMFAENSALPMLQQSSAQIISTLKANKLNLQKNPKIVQEAVQRYLLPNVDVNGMSRSVLGRQAWNAASASERAEFSKAFTQLVIRTYSTPLSKYTDEAVKFLPQRAKNDGHFTRVDSLIIRSNGQNIPLSYSLVNKNGQWKVYDLSVEGVSLLQSFHNQFGQILQSSSMHDLIQQMNQNKKAA